MERTESQENYLETILILNKKSPNVRSVDIANELGFKKPSISIAMRTLREKGYISISSEGYITLTESGKKIADGVYERHLTITEVFKKFGVPAATAEEDACRIEHIISEDTFKAFKKILKLK